MSQGLPWHMFDLRDDVELAEVRHPSRQEHRNWRWKKCQILSVDILQLCSCIVVCGGNCHAILQSSRRADESVLLALKSTVHAGRCLLLARSAGATVSGESAEYTRDRASTLVHSTGAPLWLRGFGLVPNHSFMVHCSVSEAERRLRNWPKRCSHAPLGSWIFASVG